MISKNTLIINFNKYKILNNYTKIKINILQLFQINFGRGIVFTSGELK